VLTALDVEASAEKRGRNIALTSRAAEQSPRARF
jgi:hypothetical protein